MAYNSNRHLARHAGILEVLEDKSVQAVIEHVDGVIDHRLNLAVLTSHDDVLAMAAAPIIPVADVAVHMACAHVLARTLTVIRFPSLWVISTFQSRIAISKKNPGDRLATG
jgi:hypothetical protein